MFVEPHELVPGTTTTKPERLNGFFLTFNDSYLINFVPQHGPSSNWR